MAYFGLVTELKSLERGHRVYLVQVFCLRPNWAAATWTQYIRFHATAVRAVAITMAD